MNPVLPQVKQCTDPNDDQFGAVAVAAVDPMTGDPRPGVWMVGHPGNGGHWARDEEVASWTDLEPKAAAE